MPAWLASEVIKSGLVIIKDDCSVDCLWRKRWLVLTEKTLYIHKHQFFLPQKVINLRDIRNVERIDLMPYSFLLRTTDEMLYLSLKGDDELYGWQDDIYSRSPLIMSVSNPTNFVHNIHVGFDPVSGFFTGLPDAWRKMLEDNERCPQVVPEEGNLEGMPDLGPKQLTKPSGDWEERVTCVRSGYVNVKKDGSASWLWREKRLVVREKNLLIHKNKSLESFIDLRDISKVERVDLKSHCLMLQTGDIGYYVALKSDDELYSWLDDIYTRCPSLGVTHPWNFVHRVHAGYDPVSQAFTGLPPDWSKLLATGALDQRNDCMEDMGLSRTASHETSTTLVHSPHVFEIVSAECKAETDLVYPPPKKIPSSIGESRPQAKRQGWSIMFSRLWRRRRREDGALLVEKST